MTQRSRVAVHDVHQLILDRAHGAVRALDLGCRSGAGLCTMARLREGVHGVGVSLRASEVRAATERALILGLDGPCRFVEADFHALPKEIGHFDLAYAVGTWSRVQDPPAFLAGVVGRLAPGGQLIMVDDFATDDASPRAERARAALRRHRHVSTLARVDQTVAWATQAGFAEIDDEDLTPRLPRRRIKDWLVAVAAHTVGWLPSSAGRVARLRGHHARQRCLSRGFVTYHLVQLARNEPVQAVSRTPARPSGEPRS